MFGRNKVAMIVAEFIGTFSLASVVLAMIGRTSFPFFAAVIAGGTLGLMTLVLGNVSSAHLNPAVTVGMWTQRRIDTARAVVYIVAQFLGGLVAWTLSEYLLNSSLKSIAGDKFDERVLIAEAIGTFVFAFGIAAAISQGYRGLKYAVTVGGSLTLGIVLATFAGNGLLNPAVALGVQSWNFAYVTGPILGAVVGMSTYSLLFAPRPARAARASKAAVASKSKTTKKPIKKTTKKR